jgi:hypothetical protein
VARFLSFDVKWPCTSCSSRTTDHIWGVTPHAEGDPEGPGSGGASPYPELRSPMVSEFMVPDRGIGLFNSFEQQFCGCFTKFARRGTLTFSNSLDICCCLLRSSLKANP